MPKIDLAARADQCCGCGACTLSCPVQAIAMQEAADGSKYPAIDGKACIRCGKCTAVCGAVRRLPLHAPQAAYAAVGRDEQLVSGSASGGIFATLARAVMAEGGMAAGAVMQMDDDMQVRHILTGSEGDIPAMQGSKYVQSDAWRCFGDAITALRAGKQVLFSGTPCQVAALKQLTGDPENLITIDLICHGVPSARMLRDYIRILEGRLRGRITRFAFRDKRTGKTFSARIELQRRGKAVSLSLSSSLLSFYRHFLSGAIYRDSCYACPYAGRQRAGDITIGDYWGVDDQHRDDIAAGRMPTRSDWSCLLVNTGKGQTFLRAHASLLTLAESDTDRIAQGNAQLNAPSRAPAQREEILRLYADSGYGAVEKQFIRSSCGTLRYHWRLFKALHKDRGGKTRR